MDLKKIFSLTGFIILGLITTAVVSAEESPMAAADSAVLSSEQQAAPKSINETQWAWGEVTNLDAQAKTLTLKYLDYETDQEKDLVLAIDDKTTFENIKSFDEIKIKDTLSIDYMVGTDGKNTAKNINLEKPDVAPAAVMPAVEDAKPVEAVAEQPVAAAVVPEVTPPVAQQPATTIESPAAAANEAPAQSAEATPPAPAVQEGQAQ